MEIQAFAASDRGQRREGNEDHFLIDESLGLYMVCDGMGGHAAGEVASERSVSFTAEYIRDRRDLLENASEAPDGYFRVLELAESATQDASRRLHELACADPTLAGMGTTMTLLLIVDNKAIMSHVGDSRLYMLRHGEIHQLSSDHTLANELRQSGTLTAEEAANSKYNHVLTRTIGQQKSVQVESLLFDLMPDDICLLCSDGLSNYFDKADTLREFLASETPATVPAELINYANSRGGADNITLVLMRASSGGKDFDSQDIKHRIDVLRSTFLCRKFSASRLMRVLNIASIVHCASGQKMFAAGQSCDGMYVVLDGSFSIGDPDVLSEEVISDDLFAGDVIGESTLLHEGKLNWSVSANEPSRLLFLSRTDFIKLTRRLPKLGNSLLRNLGVHLSKKLHRSEADKSPAPEDTAPLKRRST